MPFFKNLNLLIEIKYAKNYFIVEFSALKWKFVGRQNVELNAVFKAVRLTFIRM